MDLHRHLRRGPPVRGQTIPLVWVQGFTQSGLYATERVFLYWQN